MSEYQGGRDLYESEITPQDGSFRELVEDALAFNSQDDFVKRPQDVVRALNQWMPDRFKGLKARMFRMDGSDSDFISRLNFDIEPSKKPLKEIWSRHGDKIQPCVEGSFRGFGLSLRGTDGLNRPRLYYALEERNKQNGSVVAKYGEVGKTDLEFDEDRDSRLHEGLMSEIKEMKNSEFEITTSFIETRAKNDRFSMKKRMNELSWILAIKPNMNDEQSMIVGRLIELSFGFKPEDSYLIHASAIIEHDSNNNTVVAVDQNITGSVAGVIVNPDRKGLYSGAYLVVHNPCSSTFVIDDNKSHHGSLTLINFSHIKEMKQQWW